MSDEVGQYHRGARRRWVAARYDGAHAMLVRIVHPVCFAAFAITALVIAGGIVYLVLSGGGSGGDDIIGFLIGTVAVLAAVVVAAFAFVITPWRAIFGFVVLASWAVALGIRDEVPTWLLWTLWVVASLSVLLQVAL